MARAAVRAAKGRRERGARGSCPREVQRARANAPAVIVEGVAAGGLARAVPVAAVFAAVDRDDALTSAATETGGTAAHTRGLAHAVARAAEWAFGAAGTRVRQATLRAARARRTQHHLLAAGARESGKALARTLRGASAVA